MSALRRLFPAAVVALVIFLVNANNLRGFFLADDYEFLRRVNALQDLGELLRYNFLGAWVPLSDGSWMLDSRIWGLDPLGYHLTNLLIKWVGAMGIWAVVRRVWPEQPAPAWIATLLFAVHPVHDGAISYMSGRAHAVGIGLSLWTVWFFLGARRRGGWRGTPWLLAALIFAALAGLGKETALTLPAWIATAELCLGPRSRGLVARLGRTAGFGLLFGIPMMAVLQARFYFVGMESKKMTGTFGNFGQLWERVLVESPGYSLLSMLPVPFGHVGLGTLQSASWLGWLLIAGVALGCIAALRETFSTREDAPRAPFGGLFLFAVVGAILATGPVLWADQNLHRRYIYPLSVCVVLGATPLLYWAWSRWKTAVTCGLAVLLVAGAWISLERNALHRRSGEVARQVLETVRGAPLDAPVRRGLRKTPVTWFVTLPRGYGGTDLISGAHLFHPTDLFSAFLIFKMPQQNVHHALRTYHAHDYRAGYEFLNERVLRLTVDLEEEASYEAAILPRASRSRDQQIDVSLLETDPERRRLVYRIVLPPRFWSSNPPNRLFLYSDGALEPIEPPERRRPRTTPRSKRRRLN